MALFTLMTFVQTKLVNVNSRDMYEKGILAVIEYCDLM